MFIKLINFRSGEKKIKIILTNKIILLHITSRSSVVIYNSNMFIYFTIV